MDKTKKKIEVQARVRVIGKIKLQELIRPETFNTVVEVDRSTIHMPGLHQAAVHTATREAFEQQFIRRMRTDADTKRKVGGTKWMVEVVELRYKDAI